MKAFNVTQAIYDLHHLPEYMIQSFEELMFASKDMDNEEKFAFFINVTLHAMGVEIPMYQARMLGKTAMIMITPILKDIMPNLYPIVGFHNGYHNTARLKTFDEAWNFVLGFKDGVVGVTGSQSLASYCNGNLSSVDDIYWNNFNELWKTPEIASTNFNQANIEVSFRAFFGYVKKVFQWPYFVLYSCYYALGEIYDPFETENYPNLFAGKNPDGTYVELTLFEQFLGNLIFNLGFMLSDFNWMISVEATEENYWYRNGYVYGDFYMRWFYRSLVSVPVK